MRKGKGFGSLLFILIVIFVITSWIVNVVKFCKCDFEAPYKDEIIHGVGLIPGVSIVAAWM